MLFHLFHAFRLFDLFISFRPESACIKAVMVCQTDTASSCNNSIPALRAAIDAAGHDALCDTHHDFQLIFY